MKEEKGHCTTRTVHFSALEKHLELYCIEILTRLYQYLERHWCEYKNGGLIASPRNDSNNSREPQIAQRKVLPNFRGSACWNQCDFRFWWISYSVNQPWIFEDHLSRLKPRKLRSQRRKRMCDVIGSLEPRTNRTRVGISCKRSCTCWEETGILALDASLRLQFCSTSKRKWELDLQKSKWAFVSAILSSWTSGCTYYALLLLPTFGQCFFGWWLLM